MSQKLWLMTKTHSSCEYSFGSRNINKSTFTEVKRPSYTFGNSKMFFFRSRYFISTNRDPRRRHLFRVGIRETGDHLMQTPQCLTCEYPDTCQYITASFSKSGKYYVLHCKGPGIPSFTLKSTFDDRREYTT